MGSSGLGSREVISPTFSAVAGCKCMVRPKEEKAPAPTHLQPQVGIKEAAASTRNSICAETAGTEKAAGFTGQEKVSGARSPRRSSERFSEESGRGFKLGRR